MSVQTLIRLDTTESYGITPELYPTITHCRLVNVKWEVTRMTSEKEGLIELWFAKGYLEGNVFYEAIGYPGININVSDPAVQGIMESDTLQGKLYNEISRVLSQLMIDLEEIPGTLEEIGFD